MAILKAVGPGIDHEKEDLAPVIEEIDPTETPIYSNMAKGGAKAIRHDFTVQELNVPNGSNAHPQGAEFSTLTTAMKVPARFDNFCQILLTPGEVADTFDSVDTLGGQKETARQKVMKALEQRRDCENIISGNTAKNGPTDTRLMASFGAWITNVSVGATLGAGPTGDGSDVTVPGDVRAFDTAALINDTMQLCYTQGGRPRVMYMPPTLKPKFSALPDAWASGTEARTSATARNEISFIGASDGYLSDYGFLDVAMSIWMHTYDTPADQVIYLIDPRYMDYLCLPGRDMTSEDLAKTGDNRKFQVKSECTLEPSAPKAHGAIWALDSTA